MTFEFEAKDEAAVRNVYWQTGRDEVAFDVGCGYGSYSVDALENGTTVYAVESNSAILRDMINRVGVNNGMYALHAALGDGKPPPEELRGQVAAVNLEMLPGDVEWSTLDRVVDELNVPRLDWLKVDVEGGELAVVRGGMNTLRKFKPRLVIEDHSEIYPYVKDHGHFDEMRGLLEDLGYLCSTVKYNGKGPPRRHLVGSWDR